MKKSILLSCATLVYFVIPAQTYLADFETFTLQANSAYSPSLSIPFQSNGVIFQYSWNSDWDFWDGGFAYTNIKDSTTSGLANEYGVRAYNGYTNSSMYAVGQDESTIKMSLSQSTVTGFYVTNTTYAYKAMLNGDAFARKFGDTTGTGTGATLSQGSYPDFFKLVVKGYLNGSLKTDSIEVFLADFTYSNSAQDYILDTWQYVSTSALGAVDSIQFFLRSSDVGEYGINTPLYFAIDNFEFKSPMSTGIKSFANSVQLQIFPNPFSDYLQFFSQSEFTYKLYNCKGELLAMQENNKGEIRIDMSHLKAGIYFIECIHSNEIIVKKLIKN